MLWTTCPRPVPKRQINKKNSPAEFQLELECWCRKYIHPLQEVLRVSDWVAPAYHTPPEARQILHHHDILNSTHENDDHGILQHLRTAVREHQSRPSHHHIHASRYLPQPPLRPRIEWTTGLPNISGFRAHQYISGAGMADSDRMLSTGVPGGQQRVQGIPGHNRGHLRWLLFSWGVSSGIHQRLYP